MKKVGIIGGVGPEASNKFCEMLIRYKTKSCDQDNIPFIHLCNPRIPDRTEFILGIGENPIPEIVKTGSELERMGVDFIIIPCNTAHCFLPQIQEEISIPIIDMTKVLVKKIITEKPFIERVGILATTGSIKGGLFQNYFKSVGIETILPDEINQEKLVMEAIYGKKGIKAGKKIRARRLLTKAIENLVARGAQAIILGCTEIPLAIKQKDFEVELFDPMEIVAREIIRYVESEEEEVVTIKYILSEANEIRNTSP